MSNQIKIGIVEDELLIAEKIKHLLVEIGYAVCEPVSDYDEAVNMLQTEILDLLLLDINLGKGKDGIDVAKHINDLYQLPFIFLTANNDKATIERAKAVRPYAYLIKPYSKDELFAAIEIAFNNFKVFSYMPQISGIDHPSVKNRSKDAVKDNSKNTTYTFIRDQNRFIKIQFETIVYIESMQNYVVIHTKDDKRRDDEIPTE